MLSILKPWRTTQLQLNKTIIKKAIMSRTLWDDVLDAQAKLHASHPHNDRKLTLDFEYGTNFTSTG